jgi:hypothetical protein
VKTELAEFNVSYGLVLTSGIGLFLLAMSTATTVTQRIDPNKTDNAPIPITLKPLILVKSDAGPIACGALVALDLDLALANGALGFLENLL